MSKRKLYPRGRGDRVFFWYFLTLTLLSWAAAITLYLIGEKPRWSSWIVLLCLPPLVLVLLHFMQQIPRDMGDPYANVISEIAEMGTQLGTLATFLKQEQIKVAESEAILRKLENEKAQLEPVVATHRETVNAILAAHSKITSSRAWKERAIGFISGVITSLLASILFELFRH